MAQTRLALSPEASIVVTAHAPNPFEFFLTFATEGIAALSPAVPAGELVDGALTYTAADRFLWCIGTQQFCTPPFQGTRMFGVRLAQESGIHFGWVGVYCINFGFGQVDLRISGAAVNSCAGAGVRAGVLEGTVPGCGTVDFNCDGDVGTDGDIEAFFACLVGHCPLSPCTNTADFNRDGDSGTDADIEAFFVVLAGGSCST